MAREKIQMEKLDIGRFPECPDDKFIYEAQREVIRAMKMGEKCSCPLCGRLVVSYFRKLTPVIVARLIVLVGRYLISKDWEEIPTEPKGKNAKFEDLRHWGFLTFGETSDGDCFVRPTRRAYDFVRGQFEVPSHIFFYNGGEVGTSVKKVDVKSALENKYDYDELMRTVPIRKRKLKVR